MWDCGMNYCRTPVLVQPIIFNYPLSSEQIYRWSPLTVPAINASVACNTFVNCLPTSILFSQELRRKMEIWFPFQAPLGFEKRDTYWTSSQTFVGQVTVWWLFCSMGFTLISLLSIHNNFFPACFALGTLTRAWMITTVGTQTDATDPGALPQIQTHPGSTATSKFVVGMHVCLFVRG